MLYNDNFRQDDIDINITNQNMNSNTNMNVQDMGMGMTNGNPIVEAGRERCVYRNIYHEVPQV